MTSAQTNTNGAIFGIVDSLIMIYTYVHVLHYLGHVLDVLVVIVREFALGDWIKLSHTVTTDLNRGCSKLKYISSLKVGTHKEWLHTCVQMH